MKKLILLIAFLLFVPQVSAQFGQIVLVDSLEFESGQCRSGISVQIATDTFAIAYRDEPGYLKFVIVDMGEDAVIGGVIDTQQFGGWLIREGHDMFFEQVGSTDYFAMGILEDTGDDLWVCTMDFSDATNISTVFNDSLEIETDDARHSYANYVSGTEHWVIGSSPEATAQPHYYGVTIAESDGSITLNNEVDSGVNGTLRGLEWCGGIAFASTYMNAASDPTCNSMTLNTTTGQVSSVVETIVLKETTGRYPRPVRIPGTNNFLVISDIANRTELDYYTMSINPTTADLSDTPLDSWLNLASSWITPITGPIFDNVVDSLCYSGYINNTTDKQLYLHTFVLSKESGEFPVGLRSSKFITTSDGYFDIRKGAGQANLLVVSKADVDGWVYSFTTENVGEILYFASAVVQPSKASLSTFSLATASGAISDAPIDTYTLATNAVNLEEQIDMIKITGTDQYVVVWSASDNVGKMATIQISAEGVIAASATDSIDFAVYGNSPRIHQVPSSNYFTMSYFDGADTKAATFSITDAGDINPTKVDSLDITNVTYVPELCYLGSNHYIVTGWGAGSDGFLSTFGVNASTGVITAVIDAFEFHPLNFYSSDKMYQISTSQYYILASRATGANHYTFDITAATGDVVGDAVVESGTNVVAYKPRSMAPTTVDTLIVQSYVDSDSDAWLRTFRANKTDGSITDSYRVAVDSIEFEVSQGDPFYIMATSVPDWFIVGGQGTTDADGYVYSFDVNVEGGITGPADKLEVETVYCQGIVVVELSEAAGWGHKIMGIEPGKVMGLLKAEIAKVMGVE